MLRDGGKNRGPQAGTPAAKARVLRCLESLVGRADWIIISLEGHAKKLRLG